MKLGSVLVALSLVAAFGLVGCNQEKKSPAPPPTIGMAPGESAPYEETSATPRGPTPTQTIVATPATPAPGSAVAPPPAPKKAGTAKAKDSTKSKESPKAKVATYKVQKGDTFTSISKTVYGSGKFAKKIYEANKDKAGVKSLDIVDEGVELKIP